MTHVYTMTVHVAVTDPLSPAQQRAVETVIDRSLALSEINAALQSVEVTPPDYPVPLATACGMTYLERRYS